MSTQTFPSPQKSRNKKLIISSVLVVLLVIIGYLNLRTIYVGYYYLFKMDSFSAGDKIYATDHVAVGLCRLIRPITKDDIDTMQISDTEKLRLQLSLDDSLKPYMVNSGDYVSTVGNSNYIGTYIKHEFTTFLDYKTKARIHDNVFMLKPDQSKLSYNNYMIEPMPKGYTWANNNFYIYSDAVSNKETFNSTKQ